MDEDVAGFRPGQETETRWEELSRAPADIWRSDHYNGISPYGPFPKIANERIGWGPSYSKTRDFVLRGWSSMKPRLALSDRLYAIGLCYDMCEAIAILPHDHCVEVLYAKLTESMNYTGPDGNPLHRDKFYSQCHPWSYERKHVQHCHPEYYDKLDRIFPMYGPIPGQRIDAAPRAFFSRRLAPDRAGETNYMDLMEYYDNPRAPGYGEDYEPERVYGQHFHDDHIFEAAGLNTDGSMDEQSLLESWRAKNRGEHLLNLSLAPGPAPNHCWFVFH